MLMEIFWLDQWHRDTISPSSYYLLSFSNIFTSKYNIQMSNKMKHQLKLETQVIHP